MKKIVILLLLFHNVRAFSQWVAYTPNFDDTIGIYNIQVISDQIIWTAGYRPNVDDWNYGYPKTDLAFVGLTKDGGQTWNTNPIPIGEKPTLKSMCALNEDYCFIAGQTKSNKAVILKTINGGKNWIDISPPFNPSFSYANLVRFYTETTGVVTADPANDEFQVFFTNDGGQSWTLINPDKIPNPISGEFTNLGDSYEDNIWFTTNKGRIFKSVDRGQTWTVKNTPMSYLRGLSLSDEQHGIASPGYLSQFFLPTPILATDDGGNSWDFLSLTALGDSFAVFGYEYIPNSPFIMLTTCTGSILTGNFATWISPDRGASWQQISSGENIYHPTFISPTIGWGGEGQQLAHKTRMFKYDGSPLVGIFSGKTLPENWSISPNPCKDRFNLQIETDQTTEYLLLINDVQGKLVYSTQFMQEGDVPQTIQFGSVPAGMYVVTLASEDGKVSKILEVQ